MRTLSLLFLMGCPFIAADQDGDGLAGDVDCDDRDADVTAVTWYADADDDGAGNPDITSIACATPPAGAWVDNALDCDDTNPAMHPDSPEVVDGFDNDCDGRFACYVDADGDGHGAPGSQTDGTTPCDGEGLSLDSLDCDDTDPDRYPGAPERCNGILDDCSAAGVPADEADADGDGSRLCDPEADCDDDDPTRYPGADEILDDIDNDCDGSWLCPADEDNDEHGDLAATTLVSGACPTLLSTDDCDDANETVFPGAAELVDGLDNDCDGTYACFIDADEDGVGADLTLSSDDCGTPGLATVDGDCDDSDDQQTPGAVERCNGMDNDCDPATLDVGRVSTDDQLTSWPDLQAAIEGAPEGALIELCGGDHPLDQARVQTPIGIIGIGDGFEEPATLVRPVGALGRLLDVVDTLALTDLTIDGGQIPIDASGACISVRPSPIPTATPSLQLTNVDVTGCVASSTDAVQSGGALRIETGSLQVVGGSFVSNHADSVGGAIRVDGADSISIEDTILTDNTAGTVGGAIHMIPDASATPIRFDGLAFARNTAPDDASAVYFSGSEAVDLQIIGNLYQDHNLAGTAGAVHLVDVASVFIDSSSFNRNRADGGPAGALLVDRSATSLGGGTVEILGSTFRENHADGGGGALRVQDATALTLTGVLFDGNSSIESGGALYLAMDSDDSPSTFGEVTFLDNASDSSGGAVFVTGLGGTGTLTIDAATFEDNEANDAGGAMRVSQTDLLALTNSDFRRNESIGGGGGALHIDRNRISGIPDVANPMRVTMEALEFTDNVASGDGGAIEIIEPAALTITDSDFTGNLASNVGGALDLTVSATEAPVVLQELTFSDNQCVASGDGAAGVGGAVYITSPDGSGSVRLLETVFESNLAGGGGGAMWTTDLIDLQAVNATFTANQTLLGDGGGLAFRDRAGGSSRSNLVISHSAFTANTSPGSGGALRIDGEQLTDVILFNLNFSENSAAAGGGFRARGAHVIAEGVEFSDNRGVQGTALMIDGDSGNPEPMNLKIPRLFAGPGESAIDIDAPGSSVVLSEGIWHTNRETEIDILLQASDAELQLDMIAFKGSSTIDGTDSGVVLQSSDLTSTSVSYEGLRTGVDLSDSGTMVALDTLWSGNQTDIQLNGDTFTPVTTAQGIAEEVMCDDIACAQPPPSTTVAVD